MVGSRARCDVNPCHCGIKGLPKFHIWCLIHFLTPSHTWHHLYSVCRAIFCAHVIYGSPRRVRIRNTKFFQWWQNHSSWSKYRFWQLVLTYLYHTSYCYCSNGSGSKISLKGSNITKVLSSLRLFSWAAFLVAFLPSLSFSILIHSREWNRPRRRRSSWTQLILASCMDRGDAKMMTKSRVQLRLWMLWYIQM